MSRLIAQAIVAIAVVGCGFDPGTSSSDAGADDGADNDSTSSIDGEGINLFPGWEVSVWREFGDDFSFAENVFSDAIASYSNAPIGLMVLEGDFDPGLAVLTVGTIIELPAASGFVERSFFRATADGPDAMWDAAYCGSAVLGEPALCVASTSADQGDGVFVIDSEWGMTAASTSNNVHSVAFDELGLFDAIGGERVYQERNGTVELFGGVAVGTIVASTMEVLPDGDLLVATHGEPSTRLVRISSIDHAASNIDARVTPDPPISFSRQAAFSVVRGDTTALDGDAHAVVEGRELVAYDGVARTTLASTDPADGWTWVQAVIAPEDHELGGTQPTIYLLESNRIANRDRILRFVAP